MPIKRLAILILLSSFFTFYVCSPVWSEVPLLINYQGKLTDSNGTPLNGSQLVNFYIYDMENGGTHLWTEGQLVDVDDGIFHVQLGADKALNANLFDNASLYLEVEIFGSGIGWETLTPRQQLTSNAFAVKAAIADGVPDGVIDTIHLAAKAVNGDKIGDGEVGVKHIANRPTVGIFLNTPQPLTAQGGFELVQFDSENWDSAEMHDHTSPIFRGFVFAPEPGIYLVTANIFYEVSDARRTTRMVHYMEKSPYTTTLIAQTDCKDYAVSLSGSYPFELGDRVYIIVESTIYESITTVVNPNLTMNWIAPIP